MEEDAGVKAPVTRLRRRISIEQSEESKSPALSTPTKKRGGRRAVKPDLELIDENTPDSSTTKKTAKKAAVKDVIDTVEEKTVTPSRRSTRIKSNTSIVSETALAIDSPRAKRAARRTSQIGSDSEAPPTPIRQTRRARKDSTSSIEKVEVQPSTKPAIQITDVIIEEPESNAKKSSSETDEKNSSPSNVRKSPRLVEKSKKNTSINENANNVQAEPNEPGDQITTTKIKNSVESNLSHTHETKDEKFTELQIPQKNRLSIISMNLIKNLNTEAKTENNNLNKSTSALEITQNVKLKRKRTKSWTTLNISSEHNFYSDNEGSKKKIKEGTKIPMVQINKMDSGDGLNISLDQDKVDKSISKKKKKNSNSFVVEDIDTSMTNLNNNKSIDKNTNENDEKLVVKQNSSEKNNVNRTNKLFENEPSVNMHTMVYIEDNSDTNSVIANIQNRYDEHEDQCVPVIHHDNQLENAISQFSLSSDKISNIENKSKDALNMNDSCEPMDVDETIPESLLISEIKTEINSISCLQLDKSMSKEKFNTSKRKSSISHNLNKSGNENKSTLILSQLKDTSTAETNNITKSPQIKSNILSKTTDDLNTSQENDVNKKNLSLNYVTTSTPLQQKKLQKLSNINTSIITSNNDPKDVIKNKLNKSKSEKTLSDNVENETSKNKLNLNNSENANNKTDNKLVESISENVKKADSTEDSDSDKESVKSEREKIKGKSFNSFNKSSNQSVSSNKVDSDNEMISDEESQNTINLVDDEAEDVGDNYESGDSQDENERLYLKENEIIEKGETLTSENDFSNDSDYEKDSFIVSSDEEDNELLEGTEDDLSMSDNELKMTAISKKKFNERKTKEQKKASREMFESRHKLNVSNKSSSSEVGKSKKHKRQQLSFSESEDETVIKSKKHNRMRLDSSHEASLLEDKNEKKISNKKTKRLSKSICDENVLNENEISMSNETVKEIDPLSTNVKEEPKTPYKGNSSIAFINTDNDPNIESELTKTQTEFSDPLEDSTAEDDSLSSDNENIIQNYDSMLEGLNETKKTKTKTSNISLNITDKKQKKKKNTAIVDELNLTQVKSTKKTKDRDNKQKQKDSNTLSNNKMTKPDIDDSASSSSIDLNLLFSEDSNSSENIQSTKNNESSNAEHYIPLKRIEGKTNIREYAEDTDENNVSFFIDTEGTLNNSLRNTTSKTNKKKLPLENNDSLDSNFDEITTKKDESLIVNNAVPSENSDSDAPMDVPFKKDKRTSKVQDISEENGKDETDFVTDKCNKSVTKTPNSEKKKKKKSRESQILEHSGNEVIEDNSLNMLLGSAKKKKSVNEINEELTEKDTTEQASDKSLNKTPSSHKKKKRMSQSKTHEEDDEEGNMFFGETTTSSKKKKLSYSPEDNEIELKEEPLNVSILRTPGSQKKKKKSLNSQEKEQQANISEPSLNNSKIKTPDSQNKMNVTDSMEEKQKVYKEEDQIGSAKKSKIISSSSCTVESVLLTVELSENNDTSAKKRKRQSSVNIPIEDIIPKDEVNTSKKLNESLVGSKKKKRKISQNREIISIADPTTEGNDLLSLIVSKKNKLEEEIQNVPNSEMAKRSRNNKRKQREDDEGNRVAKVAKENSIDKVHIPRLPANILKQLDDKRQPISTVKKTKVVSTTQFSVVEARKRRNKPSNYLEESVYLNDDESKDKRHKKRLQKPKVLPFVPTALTSASGYTTNFKVNVTPTEMKFIAQSNTVNNFKDDYLFNKKIKRQGTYELYKRNRNIKISKF